MGMVVRLMVAVGAVEAEVGGTAKVTYAC
jgi:hypothetical protein